jgi:chromosome segregation protein
MQNKMKEISAEEEKRKQKVFFLQDEMQALQSKLAAASQAKNSEQVEMAKIETRAEDLAHEVVTEMGVAVESILAKGIELVEVLALENLAVEIQKNKYKLSLIGGIDEEVVKEFEETKARHDVLDRELLDLQKASAELEKLVLELDEMMKKKRDFAFKKIKKEFAKYFSILFEGGKADLLELYEEEKKGDEEAGEAAESLEIVGGRKKKVLSTFRPATQREKIN